MLGHAGFDRGAFPGQSVMDWLKANTNLVWCGYYLAPSPSQPGTTWMGKRQTLVNAGWGIAPLYVGEQVIPPGSENPSVAKGTVDGADAAQLMLAEGFDAGSCVYLDLEDGSLPARLADYTRAWIAAVKAGGFQAGVYCSHVIADQVSRLGQGVPIWAFKIPTNAPHDSAGPPFREDNPSGSGFALARAWQLDQNGAIKVPVAPGGKLIVDLNSATSANPGGAVLTS